jgi:hypothetical protein
MESIAGGGHEPIKVSSLVTEENPMSVIPMQSFGSFYNALSAKREAVDQQAQQRMAMQLMAQRAGTEQAGLASQERMAGEDRQLQREALAAQNTLNQMLAKGQIDQAAHNRAMEALQMKIAEMQVGKVNPADAMMNLMVKSQENESKRNEETRAAQPFAQDPYKAAALQRLNQAIGGVVADQTADPYDAQKALEAAIGASDPEIARNAWAMNQAAISNRLGRTPHFLGLRFGGERFRTTSLYKDLQAKRPGLLDWPNK